MADQENTCLAHKEMELKIKYLQDQVEKLEDSIVTKEQFSMFKEQVIALKGSLEKEIEELKLDSERHFKQYNSLNTTLIRLEETTKNLKETVENMTANTKEQNKELIDRVDKLYQLILNFNQPQAKESKSQSSDSTIVDKAIERSSKTMLSIWGEASMTTRSLIVVIVILVCVVVYLLTGNWVLDDVIK